MVNFFITYSVITLVSLGTTFFILMLNLDHARRNLKALDFRTIAIELITLTIWVAMFVRFLKSDAPNEILANSILFILSIAFGVLLIRSTMREMRIRESVDRLRNRQNEVNIRLKKIDQEKTEFVSLASHQLRGPLSSIQGYSSMLLEEDFGKVPKGLKEPITRIFESSRAMGALLNDFLDVTNIEKAEIEYDIGPINLIELLESVTDDFTLSFQRDEIELKKTYDPDSKIEIMGDSLRIRQMLNKILDNSLKYTPVGAVTVSVAEKNGDAVITVSDTGIGIAHDQIKDLFHKFKRASNANGISVTGSGLGLYVAREIAEAQGGRIWVESQGVGKGSNFYIALPVHKR